MNLIGDAPDLESQALARSIAQRIRAGDAVLLSEVETISGSLLRYLDAGDLATGMSTLCLAEAEIIDEAALETLVVGAFADHLRNPALSTRGEIRAWAAVQPTPRLFDFMSRIRATGYSPSAGWRRHTWDCLLQGAAGVELADWVTFMIDEDLAAEPEDVAGLLAIKEPEIAMSPRSAAARLKGILFLQGKLSPRAALAPATLGL